MCFVCVCCLVFLQEMLDRCRTGGHMRGDRHRDQESRSTHTHTHMAFPRCPRISKHTEWRESVCERSCHLSVSVSQSERRGQTPCTEYAYIERAARTASRGEGWRCQSDGHVAGRELNQSLVWKRLTAWKKRQGDGLNAFPHTCKEAVRFIWNINILQIISHKSWFEHFNRRRGIP